MVRSVPGPEIESAGSTSPRAVDIAAAAQLACLLEVSAPKPGNVSPGRHFSDMRYQDFLASAAAIGCPLARAGTQPVGTTIRQAIEATAQWTRANTNLGIVLLLAPLVRAAVHLTAANGSRAVSDLDHLRATVRQVLDATTVDDAREAYAAIRLANPGGLGKAENEDVAGEPTVTLLQAMRLASERDGIAREYATGFETTFGIAAPALLRARAERLSWDDAIVETFLTLIAAAPDTHISRRAGADLAATVSRMAHDALVAGGVRSERGRRLIDRMDVELRDSRNRGNPGTAADLTAAAIFVALIAGGWWEAPHRRTPEGT